MFKEAYFEVEGEAADLLFLQINSLSDISDFSSKTARLLTHPLCFYPKYHFLKVIDHHQNPLKTINLIYQNQDMIILDGTKNPFKIMNEKKCLLINEDTIKSYIRFYFSYVRSPDGKFFIVDSPDHIPWLDEPTITARRAISKMMCPLDIIENGENDEFYLKGSIYYKNALYESDISVDKNGNIKLFNQELLVNDLPAIATI